MSLITRTAPSIHASTFNAPSDQESLAQSAPANSLLRSAAVEPSAARALQLTLLHPSSAALETEVQSSSVNTRAASSTPAPAMPKINPAELVGRLSLFASSNGFGFLQGQRADTKDMVMRYAVKYGSLDFSLNDDLMNDFAKRFKIPGADGEGAAPQNWKQPLSTQLLRALVGEDSLKQLEQTMALRPMAYLSGASIKETRAQVIADLAQQLKSDFPVASEYSRYLPALAEQLAPIVRPDPIIYRQDLSSEVANGARQWIELTTGMQLARDYGVDPQRLSSAQLLELVQAAQTEEAQSALAGTDADTVESMPIAQYKLAMLARAHGIDMSQEGSADKLKTVIEQAYADEIQTVAALEQLGDQPPSRKQMAIDFMRAAGKDPYGEAPRLGAGKHEASAPKKYWYEVYMSGGFLNKVTPYLAGLPSLNDEFDQRFDAFTSKASSGVQQLLQAQLSRRFGNTALSNDARFKIHAPTLNYNISNPAQGSSSIEGGYGDSGATTFETVSIDSSLGYIVEDTTAGANDPRFYWYSIETPLQGLQPVDLQGQSLNQWIRASKDKLFNRELQDITVKNARQRGTVGLGAASFTTLGDGGLKSALQKAGAIHATELSKSRDEAYAATGDEQFLDTLADKYIPGYGTYKKAKQGKILEAILSGVGDLCTVLPYVGKGVKAALLAGKLASAAAAVGKATATMKKGIDLTEKAKGAVGKVLTALQLIEMAQAVGDTEYKPAPIQAPKGGWQPWNQAQSH